MQLPKKIHDLSQPIFHNCPGWPGKRLATIDLREQAVNNGANSEWLSLDVHTATHVDAPWHFVPEGKKLDQLPLDTFAGPGVFFDLRDRVKPGEAITPDDIQPLLPQIDKGDIVILVTGYGRKYAFTREYLYNYPYLGGPAAAMLADSGAKGIGTDALSMGGFGSDEKARPSHLAILGKGLFILEGLMVPEEVLDGKKRFFSCFPLKLEGVGGSPARAVVYEF